MDVADLRAAIGNNADRYLRVFEPIAASGKRWVAGWNWAAFLHSTAWFYYRRMYGWALLNLFIPFALVFGFISIGAWIAPGANLGRAFLIVAATYLLAAFTVVPAYADALYFRRVHSGRAKPPSNWTALGAAGLALVPPLIVLVLIPSYGGYTPRAKVSEAVLAASSIRTEISEFYSEQRRLPNEQEAVRFRAERPSRWVERIVYEPRERRLVVTLREVQPTKRFALVAQEEGGELRWTCRTIDLDRKFLPPHCRE